MNRREALAMFAAAAGTVAVPVSAQQGAVGAPAAQAKIARKGRIKQGLWRVNFGADTKLTFDDQCREAARLGAYGFDLIDPADWPTLRKHGLASLVVERELGVGAEVDAPEALLDAAFARDFRLGGRSACRALLGGDRDCNRARGGREHHQRFSSIHEHPPRKASILCSAQQRRLRCS